jgi:uroporphyrinogen decarboxylase
MTLKENALRIIRFNKPEKVVTGIPEQGLCYHGCNHEGYLGGGHDCPLGSKWTDIWGTEWHKEHEGVMGFPRGNPLADTSALKNYAWPNPDDERIIGKLYSMIDALDRTRDAFICGAHRDTLWEKAYMLVGMENMMIYFYTEPGFAREVLHRIMDFQLGMARHYLKAGIEIAALGDDMGTQTGPLLGPALMNEFLVPEYRRLFDLYRKNKVMITFHSCGNVESALQIGRAHV